MDKGLAIVCEQGSEDWYLETCDDPDGEMTQMAIVVSWRAVEACWAHNLR